MIKYAEKLVKICMNKERFVTFGAADSIYNFLPEDFFRQMSLKTKLNNLVDFFITEIKKVVCRAESIKK